MHRRRDSRASSARLVVAAVSGHHEALTEGWQRAPEAETVAFAVDQGVIGAFTAGARRAALDGPLLDRAQALTRVAAMQHLAHCHALIALTTGLDAAQIPSIVLKGPALQELAWGAVTRQYADLDLLVPVDAFARALDVVAAAGGSIVDRNWEKLDRELLGQVHCGTPDGRSLDLHWHLVNQLATRRRFRIPMGELFARAVPTPVPGGTMVVLDPNDMLIHVALHAAISGGHRLVWLLDIRRCAERTGVDWDIVRDRSAAWHTSLPVAAMLARAVGTVGACVPAGVIESLVPRAGLPVIRALSSWEPSGRLPGGGSLRRVVARSLRDNLAATAGATATAGVEMGRRLVDRHEYWLDPKDPRHVRFRSGGEDGRARYLARVAATDRFGHFDGGGVPACEDSKT